MRSIITTQEESATPEVSGRSGSTDGPDSDAMSAENMAAGLDALKRDSFQPNAIETPQQAKPMFVLPHWHKAYADALLCADSLESPALISWAEMEIQARYLTAFACPIEAVESRDLNRAMEVLSQLKKAASKTSRAEWILASWESLV